MLFEANVIEAIIMIQLIKNAVLYYSTDHERFSNIHIQILKFNVKFNVN